MGLFGGGSSSSSSQTLTNTVSINPIFNMGSDNDTKSGFEAITEASSTSSAENRDELSMAASAGVAVGGGSAQGGPASLARSGDESTDIQPNNSRALQGSTGIPKNMMIMGGGVLVIGAAVLYFVNRKKR